MKRVGGLFEKIAEPHNLRLAFLKAVKGKSRHAEAQAFRANLPENLSALQKGLLSGTAEIGDYHYFRIFEPKERTICAAAFPQRVLHHAIMNLCGPVFENYAIHDSYACRKGKGTHAAIHKAHQNCRRYAYFLKTDVSKYFDSIRHDILLNLLNKQFKEPRLLELFKNIIQSYETSSGRGLPIGNLTSQFFANHYLGHLDHFVKESLGARAYVRYMDDSVYWSDSKEQLTQWKTAIRQFLREELDLTLKNSIHLEKTSRGLNFLGIRCYSEVLRLAKTSKKRFRTKFKKYEHDYATGAWDAPTLCTRMTALVAFTKTANCAAFRQHTIARYGMYPNGL
jgi:RNA-directed DNA polymerase